MTDLSMDDAPARVLIVDNDADVAAILTQCIEMRGLEVECVEDGEQGLERILQQLPAVEAGLSNVTPPIVELRPIDDAVLGLHEADAEAGLSVRSEEPGPAAPVRARLDVVLLDLRMPRLGGRALLERLHERVDAVEDGVAALPLVIVLSGFIDDADRSALEKDALVARIFKKPFDFVELLGAIDEVAAESRSRTGEIPSCD